MKKKKSLLSLLLLVAMLMTTGILSISVSAVEGSYNSFRVSGTVSKDTSEIVNNNKDNTYYWVWAAPPSGRDRIVHRGVLHNSDHAKRSDEILVYEDTTNQAASKTKKYYYYHFNVRSHFDSDGYATISGTWGWMYPES